MGLFSKIKKQKNIENIDENQGWNKSFKRNFINKTAAIQQGFEFAENVYEVGLKEILGTKKGLSYNIKNINSEQIKILKNCAVESTASELIKILNRANKTKFKQTILTPLIDCGFFELTIPEKPTSPKQKYRLTQKFVKKNTNFDNRAI